MSAQYWGKTDKGAPEYMLDCPACGYTRRTEWDGKPLA